MKKESIWVLGENKTQFDVFSRGNFPRRKCTSINDGKYLNDTDLAHDTKCTLYKGTLSINIVLQPTGSKMNPFYTVTLKHGYIHLLMKAFTMKIHFNAESYLIAG